VPQDFAKFFSSRCHIPFVARAMPTGSVKRCAAAVGEGGMAIAGVQIALAASAARD
jgi:hypothetical protein